MVNRFQEALDSLDIMTCIKDSKEVIHMSEINTLQELIDKETPKKVIRNITKETKDTEYVCPNCKSLVMKVGICNYIDNYCSHCGQALDWSEYYE